MSGFDNKDSLLDAVRHSASNPVGDYPPLAQSVFAGDTVAVVLQKEISRPVEVLKSVIDLLSETSVESADITVVLPPPLASVFGIAADEESADDKQHPLDSGFPQINFVVHDRNDEKALAYIAANEAALPMKVNRSIVDADVIIPVGCPVAGDKERLKDCIYPQFSNDETLVRFEKEADSVELRRNEIEFANDQLGAFFGIQFISAPGGEISQVISGTRPDCIEEARNSSDQFWSLPVSEDDQLVVATIESADGPQTWHDFISAVFTASIASASDRPIIIWSDIRKQPTAAIKRACNRQFESSGTVKLTRELSRLSGILEGRLVYLYSGLSENVTEELGLGYISGPEDLQRLVESHHNCLVVRDAHKSVVLTAEDDVD
ncbi:MAG: lactate racemase domain-containing protein [Planctomycetota bacterium]